MSTVKWHGTNHEYALLVEAVRRYCDCESDDGIVTRNCSGHRMLDGDQRAADGLLFVRSIVSQICTEEERG